MASSYRAERVLREVGSMERAKVDNGPRVTTRARCRKAARDSLPVDPTVLAHVFSALRVHHGPIALETACAVCTSWHERVTESNYLDEEPDLLIGELRSGDKPYRFDRPHDVIFLPCGDICVADCDNFRLQVVSREGIYVRDVRLSGGTSCPTGVAMGSGEALFVVEHGAHQVSKLRRGSSSGHRHASAGSWGGGDGQLRHPWGVAVLNKRVVVSDAGNDRLCVFEHDKLTWLFNVGQSGRKPGEFCEPRGMAVDGDDLYVADHRNHRVQVFECAGGAAGGLRPKRVIGGGPSAVAGRFNGPSGVCIANGKLHVAETAGQRLQVLTLAGLPLQTLGGCGPLSGVCADDEHVCATSLEGESALTLWSRMPPPESMEMISERNEVAKKRLSLSKA